MLSDKELFESLDLELPELATVKSAVKDGNLEGAKIVDLLNWTGIGFALPRSAWPRFRDRSEFRRSGVYVLTGSAEGAVDDLPTIYVGQGDEIRNRIDDHYTKKDFWDWAYAFVSNGNALNRAHITWLEHSLLSRAKKAGRSNLDNANQPKEPSLSA